MGIFLSEKTKLCNHCKIRDARNNEKLNTKNIKLNNGKF
jgi:hypothetical protein